MISSRRCTGSRPVRARISAIDSAQVAVGDLAGGEVDRDVEGPLVGAQLVPLEHLAAGRLLDPAPDRHDQAGLLGDGMNSPGSSRPRSGGSQRTSASRPAISPLAQGDDRLVVERAARSRSSAWRRSRSTSSRRSAPRPHLGVEELAAGAAAFLGPVHGGVGVADQQVGVGRLARSRPGDGDPDAGADEVLAPPIDEGLGEGGGDAVGDRHRLVLVGEAVDEDPELVAAEAGDDVARAQVRPAAAARRPQQLVAGVVAEAVVDQLEVVEVEEEDPDRRAGDGRRARARRPSESTKLSRLGRPVSESWRTRWRSASSAAWRSIASASTLAEAWTKWTSCGVKRLGSVEWTSSTPNGLSLPSITTARLLRTPSTRSAGGIEKRASVDQSSTITCRPRLERGAGVGVAGRRDAPVGADHLALEAGAEVEAAAVALELPDAGAVDALGLGHQDDGSSIRASGSPSRRARLPEPGDGRLLGGRALQLLLGDLALGDVVEDAVPDRDAGVVGLEHRLVEDPDDVAVAGDHPVVDRRRVARSPSVLRALLLERPLAVVGMQQLRPEPGSAIHSSGV